MKNIIRIIIIGSFIAFLGSCKKNNVTINNDSKIIGKWHESKLTIEQNNGTEAVHDITFTSEAFTSADYIQFNRDKTASVSQSGIYTITGKGEAISGGTVAVSLIYYTYKVSDSTLTLVSTIIHPTNGSGGNGTESIVQLDATHLVLRTSFYSPGPYDLIETAYFTRED